MTGDRLEPAFTPTQRRVAAQGVSYRAQQLAAAAMVLQRVPIEGDWAVTVRNALIESSLAHSRSLAEFFMNHPAYVRAEIFAPNWAGLPRDLVGRIYGMASEHLGHTKVIANDAEADRHPGAWPVVELAQTLVGELSRFVAALPPDVGGDFKPSPSESYSLAQYAADVRRPPEPLSDHPDVAALTVALRSYLTRGTAT